MERFDRVRCWRPGRHRRYSPHTGSSAGDGRSHGCPPVFSLPSAGHGPGSAGAGPEHPRERGGGEARGHRPAVFRPSGKEAFVRDGFRRHFPRTVRGSHLSARALCPSLEGALHTACVLCGPRGSSENPRTETQTQDLLLFPILPLTIGAALSPSGPLMLGFLVSGRALFRQTVDF